MRLSTYEKKHLFRLLQNVTEFKKVLYVNKFILYHLMLLKPANTKFCIIFSPLFYTKYLFCIITKILFNTVNNYDMFSTDHCPLIAEI